MNCLFIRREKECNKKDSINDLIIKFFLGQSVFFIYCSINMGRHEIEPKTGLNPFLKTALNVFCMHKTDFFLEFFLPLSNLIHWRL